MNEYKIVGISKPNKVKLKSLLYKSITELPIRTARKLAEQGVINIKNTDVLYQKLQLY